MITLKTLGQATPQEVLDQASKHLLTQNEKSMLGMGCAYRSQNGLACAAGCFIADEEYVPEMDEGDSGWDNLIEKQLVPSTVHDEMIIQLQFIHDVKPVSLWNMVLKQYAKDKNLQWKF